MYQKQHRSGYKRIRIGAAFDTVEVAVVQPL